MDIQPAQNSTVPVPKTPSPTILVLEDEPDMRAVLERTLRKAGYEVVAGEDGRKALPLLNANKVDLVLTDLVMPQKDGIEVILEMRREYKNVPIVAISAWGGQAAGNYLKIARAFGARATLEKPFTSEQLLRTVSQIVPPSAAA